MNALKKDPCPPICLIFAIPTKISYWHRTLAIKGEILVTRGLILERDLVKTTRQYNTITDRQTNLLFYLLFYVL